MNHLTPLPPRESAVAACSRALKESILSGDLAPGSTLPPERTLAATLGVNRLTLRAAIAQLSAAGLVVARHGSGTVVRAFREEGGVDLLPTLVSLARDQKQWKAVIADMLLVRRSLAIAVLDRLVEVLDARVLADLRAAVDAFEAVALRKGATPAEIGKADQQLVRALLRPCGAVLALAANPIFRLLEQLPELTAAMFAEPVYNVGAYRALVDGLATKEPDIATKTIVLLEALDDELLKRIKRSTRRP